MVLKVVDLCPVCTVFDQATGHCRRKISEVFEPMPERVRRRIYICDVYERKFYKLMGRDFCPHGRKL